MQIAIRAQDLQAVITVHRDNCRQSGCLILRLLEAAMAELEMSKEKVPSGRRFPAGAALVTL